MTIVDEAIKLSMKQLEESSTVAETLVKLGLSADDAASFIARVMFSSQERMHKTFTEKEVDEFVFNIVAATMVGYYLYELGARKK